MLARTSSRRVARQLYLGASWGKCGETASYHVRPCERGRSMWTVNRMQILPGILLTAPIGLRSASMLVHLVGKGHAEPSFHKMVYTAKSIGTAQSG
jgi:hypothetical protein